MAAIIRRMAAQLLPYWAFALLFATTQVLFWGIVTS
jgi:hypothetical protein